FARAGREQGLARAEVPGGLIEDPLAVLQLLDEEEFALALDHRGDRHAGRFPEIQSSLRLARIWPSSKPWVTRLPMMMVGKPERPSTFSWNSAAAPSCSRSNSVKRTFCTLKTSRALAQYGHQPVANITTRECVMPPSFAMVSGLARSTGPPGSIVP